MSERSSWAPRPAATYPNGTRQLRPDPLQAIEHVPTTPIPTVRQQVRRRPDYRDEYPDDVDDYRSRRPRRRGQLFAGLVVVLALVASVLLYLFIYQMLASVDVVSADPFGGLAGQLMGIGAVALGTVVVFVLAVLALVIARPKAIAALGLAASLLLPVGAVVVGLVHGGSVLQQHVQADIAQAGPAVAAQGADALLRELERRGVELGPLRDLITSAVGRGS